MKAIRTEKLTKLYGDFKAVDGLDLEIEGGELFALLGVNGAGKTTTVKMLSCLIPKSSGEGYVLEKSISGDEEKIKSQISVSPQESAVAANLTVYENLAFISRLYGFSAQETADRIEKMIVGFSLEEVRDRQAKKLSGGFQRRLSIAMALISEPQVLFLDEPTLGLDVISRRTLWQIIEGLKGRITIILTTHYMEEAEALADRVGIMSEGKMLAVGTPEEIKIGAGKDDFEEAFVSIVSGLCEKKGTFGGKRE